jgi:hypothetical protein
MLAGSDDLIKPDRMVFRQAASWLPCKSSSMPCSDAAGQATSWLRALNIQ